MTSVDWEVDLADRGLEAIADAMRDGFAPEKALTSSDARLAISRAMRDGAVSAEQIGWEARIHPTRVRLELRLMKEEKWALERESVFECAPRATSQEKLAKMAGVTTGLVRWMLREGLIVKKRNFFRRV